MPDDKLTKSSQEPSDTHVAVCICTYQRPQGLADLLTALCRQTFNEVPAPRVNVVVADNECSSENRAICDRFSQDCDFTLRYAEQAQRGISQARNTCLDKLPDDCDFVAMIDDDEIPDPDWLNHLLYAQIRTSADIVAGPTRPQFEPGTAQWIIDSGYFSKPHDPHIYQDLQPFPPAATCNVLIRASIFNVEGQRFDTALALSGSEDKLLFEGLKRRDKQIVWAAKAGTQETIPADRARLAYMLSEALRRGSTKYYVKSKLKTTTRLGRLRLALRSIVRSLFGILRYGSSMSLYLLTGKKQRHKAVSSLLFAVENIGFLGSVFGYRKKHY